MASSIHAALDVASRNIVVVGSTNSAMRTINVYKGKTARSWQHLPGEIVRLITTFYLLDVSASAYCPSTWEAREMWPQRFAFTTLRDAQEIERVMHLFPSWKPHLENHLFWNKACAVLDPMGSLNHLTLIQPTAGSNGALAQRVSLYRHYRGMLDASCAVCRVNFPYNSEGLGTGSAKRSTSTPSLGVISLCKEHRKSATFCGICLREAPRGELEDDYSTSGMPVCCVENEDEETWPGVEATCRQCRTEAFWRRVNNRPEWREAVDGRKWATLDWETKQSVESFIDLGEGSIRDVLQVAEEKHWLRTHTKLADMLQQALAASKYASRAEAGEAYGSDDELSDDEMEDPEMLSLTEDAGGIRDLALNDWARNRILDGHWISPADDWYNHTNQGRPRLAPAQHPCPWNRRAVYQGALDDGQGDETHQLQHPRPRTHLAPHPPSYGLCEQTYRAFQRQMREILLPPLRNIVRKIVMECNADGNDPAIRAVRMSTEDVVRELRDESAWYNGINWLERRANARLEEERIRAKDKDEDDSSSSSRSDGSHITSPVLSTTTLRTTPSPPPICKDDEVSSPLSGVPPPMSPMLRPSELLRPIPFIPVTTEHMPYYSVEAFTFVWREACAPLYQCQCSICERAMMNANMTADATVPTQVQLATVAQVPPEPKQPLAEIKLLEAPTQNVQARAEEEEDDVDESENESGDGESERGDDTSISVPESPAPLPSYQITSRKRPSSDLEPDADSDALSLSTEADADLSERSEQSRTPPKRVRREGSYELVSSPSVTMVPPPSSSPVRQRKRSSEELEEEGSDDLPVSGKRIRADLVEQPLSRILSPHATPNGMRVKAIVSGGAPLN